MIFRLKVKYLLFAFNFLLVSFVIQANEINYIDIHQAKQLYDQGALFIDTRTWIERKLGFIEGSVAMKKTEINDIAAYLITDKSRSVVTYCAVGVRASDAATGLTKLGYTNIYVIAKGQGYSHWRKAGYPTSR